MLGTARRVSLVKHPTPGHPSNLALQARLSRNALLVMHHTHAWCQDCAPSGCLFMHMMLCPGYCREPEVGLHACVAMHCCARLDEFALLGSLTHQACA